MSHKVNRIKSLNSRGSSNDELCTFWQNYPKIADIPLNDSVFLARVQLPAGLKTTYGKSLAYRTGMSASADIITDDIRLLEKLFYQLRKVTNGR
ncbi:hypothetical protein [Spirosoma spitsbergense]|uniref:hypothetical protein n=1 Tax=Spirosoma spitsbergense TaxID=431554 RepID=UPI001FE0E919|nr:hypothetical protein [Spirosoma spitsbergense]